MRGFLTATISLLGIGVVAAFFFYVYPSATTSPEPNKSAISNLQSAIPPKVDLTDPVRGNLSGTKVIIEFGDFACAYCSLVSGAVKEILSTHPEVKLVWKDFPLPSHPDAPKAALAARCAIPQNKYWQFHDQLMAKEGELSDDLYPAIAKALQLNEKRWQQCFDAALYKSEIDRSFAEGVRAGIDGIPYFFINGKKLSGLVTVTQLENALAAQ